MAEPPGSYHTQEEMEYTSLAKRKALSLDSQQEAQRRSRTWAYELSSPREVSPHTPPRKTADVVPRDGRAPPPIPARSFVPTNLEFKDQMRSWGEARPAPIPSFKDVLALVEEGEEESGVSALTSRSDSQCASSESANDARVSPNCELVDRRPIPLSVDRRLVRLVRKENRGSTTRHGNRRDTLGSSSATNTHEEVIVVVAPAGKLGLVIDTPADGGAPFVHAVKESSVIADKMKVGDKLIAVDDYNIRSMPASKVSRLLFKKSANTERRLTLLRTSIRHPNTPFPLDP